VLHLLRPDVYVSSIFTIDLDGLWRRGLRGLIVDLDNTMALYRADGPDQRLRDWVAAARERGFSLCIVSNGRRHRIDHYSRELEIPAVPLGGKPRRRPFRLALEILQTPAERTAVVGDQVFTDVLGGNRAGLYTILVQPLGRIEFCGTRLARCLERAVLRAFGLTPAGRTDGVGPNDPPA